MKALILTQSKQDVSNSLQVLFEDYNLKKSHILEISSFVKTKSEVSNYFFTGNKITAAYASQLFESEGAINALNAEFWSKAMKMTDVLSCMTAQKRNEWNDMIYELKTPEFNQESVISTLHGLLLNRNTFLADKVDGIFQKLSNTHVTNSPMGFKQRMIVDYLISSYGSITDRVEYINDLRSVISKIIKRDESKQGLYSFLSDIIKNDQFGEWFSFDGGAFKIRLYKKGTAHLEIHDEMSLELNKILAQKYPMVIGESNKSKKRTKPNNKEFHLEMNLLQFETCNILSQIAETVGRGHAFSLHRYDIENPQTLREVLETLEYLQVSKNGQMYEFNYDASMVLKEISRLGALPDQKSYQFYPTEEYLSKKLVSMLDIENYESILEPSAGLGGIAKNLPRKQTTCVEISSVHCEALKGLGFREVICQDFLKYSGKTFNKIAMNPPFTKGQAETHVKHALSLLSKDGVLVAILPSSLKGKVFNDEFKHTYSESMSGQFEDAQVSVVILKIEK